MALTKIYWTCPDPAWRTICSINRCSQCRLRLG